MKKKKERKLGGREGQAEETFEVKGDLRNMTAGSI